MADRKLSGSAVRMLRRLAILVGFLCIAVALLADLTGLTSGQGLFSRNRLTFLLIGIGFVLAGLLARKFIAGYKSFAVFLLNVIIALLLIDMVSLAIIKIWSPDELDLEHRRRFAELQDAGHAERMAWGRYEPYLVWKADTSVYFLEEIGPDGFRRTPGSISGPDSYQILFFGGSTVWGTGVSDSCTIPAYLLQMLSEEFEQPVDMKNLGQLGYVSTQELLELLFRIRDGDVPDLVIFLDGMNDVTAAYQSGIAGTHQNYPDIQQRLEQRNTPPPEGVSESLISSLLKSTNTYTLITLLTRRMEIQLQPETEILNYLTFGHDADSLADEIVAHCLRNYRLVEGLGEQWGFETAFFWQPTVWTGDKVLTEEEERFRSGGGEIVAIGTDEAWEPLIQTSYQIVAGRSDTITSVHNLAGIFDGIPDQVYTDFAGVHLTPQGNEYVAAAVFSSLLQAGQTP
jgi:lysophospholipase L1-like esterase